MVDVTKLDVRCESCDSIVNPEGPKYKLHIGLALALVFGVAGIITGGMLGIATAGAGFTAMGPMAVIGLVIGYTGGGFIAKLHDGVTCSECGSQFGGLLPWK